MDWTDEARGRLAQCRNDAERMAEFPGVPRAELRRIAADLLQVDEAENNDRYEELTRQRDKALRELATAKNKTAEVVEAVKSAVREAARIELRVKPVRQSRFDPETQSGTEEVCIAWASDWQLGKLTPDYNSEVCERRVKEYTSKVITLAKVQNAHHPVRECHLYLTGDLVEGEGIFPTQSFVVDSGLYRQMLNGIRILSNMVVDLLGFFDTVHVVGVIGNHGSLRLAGGGTDPETNMDRLLYAVVRENLKGRGFDDRLSWNIPDNESTGTRGERNWFAVDNIGDWGFLLMHGDQIRGGITGFWPGAQRKALAWTDSIHEKWDYLMFGHHHTPTRLTIGRRLAYCNGSTESSNTYAQEALAAIGHPTQFAGFVHPKYGITAEYWVALEPRVPIAPR